MLPPPFTFVEGLWFPENLLCPSALARQRGLSCEALDQAQAALIRCICARRSCAWRAVMRSS